jgi:hypothetical protein
MDVRFAPAPTLVAHWVRGPLEWDKPRYTETLFHLVRVAIGVQLRRNLGWSIAP